MTPEKTLKQATVEELLDELRTRCHYVAATIRAKGQTGGVSYVVCDEGLTPEMLGNVTQMQHAISTETRVTYSPQLRPNPRTN